MVPCVVSNHQYLRFPKRLLFEQKNVLLAAQAKVKLRSIIRKRSIVCFVVIGNNLPAEVVPDVGVEYFQNLVLTGAFSEQAESQDYSMVAFVTLQLRINAGYLQVVSDHLVNRNKSVEVSVGVYQSAFFSMEWRRCKKYLTKISLWLPKMSICIWQNS